MYHHTKSKPLWIEVPSVHFPHEGSHFSFMLYTKTKITPPHVNYKDLQAVQGMLTVRSLDQSQLALALLT